MSSYNLTKLQKAQREAWKNYEGAKKKLEEAKTISDPDSFQKAAQTVNDAWLKFKRIDVEVSQGMFLKKQGDLYGY